MLKKKKNYCTPPFTRLLLVLQIKQNLNINEDISKHNFVAAVARLSEQNDAESVTSALKFPNHTILSR